jgi:uracil-DNA glycosylase
MIMPDGLPTSRIMIVQECPGEPEHQIGRALQGLNGIEFNKMLTEAGIMRSECFATSVIRTRISMNDINTQICHRKKDATDRHSPYFDKLVTQEFQDGASLLFKEIALVKPDVIIALGNGALFALTGKWGIKQWRGSQLPFSTGDGDSAVSCTVIPTYDPGWIKRMWSERSIAVQDLRRAKGVRDTGFHQPLDGGQSRSRKDPIVGRGYNFILRPSVETVLSCLQALQRTVELSPTRLSVDIETRAGHTACIGIAWSKSDAICIPLMCVESPAGYWLEEEETAISFALYKLLTHPNAEVIGQNFAYDAQYFYRHLHFIPNLKRCTMIAQHTMFSNLPKGLDYLSSMYCDEHIYWKDESKNWDPKVGEDQLWAYNCKDCVITYEVDEKQQKSIDELGLRKVHDFQQALWWPVLETMNRGIRVEQAGKARLAQELFAAIQEREAWIIRVIGRPLNPKSPKQMADFFYREMAQRPVINRATGSPTCNDAALTKIGEREPLLLPLINVISELRSLGVFLSTFVQAPLDIDSRMRCSFNIAGTVTYRFSSSSNAFDSGMNLQNIPKGDD